MMMVGIKVTITKYISDDPQSGIVEAKFTDAWDNEHILVEKTAILSSESLNQGSQYPRDEFVECEVIEKWTDEKGRRLAKIDLNKPCGIETVNGLTTIDVEERVIIHLT
jgi:hypothetical protein